MARFGSGIAASVNVSRVLTVPRPYEGMEYLKSDRINGRTERTLRYWAY